MNRSSAPMGPYAATIGVLLAIVSWALFVVFATKGEGFWTNLWRPSAHSVESVGAFGDSFGPLTACFSGLAVILVYMTFALQKREFEALQRHLQANERRERWETLLNRLHDAIKTAQSGSKTGQELLNWMNSKLAHPMTVAGSDSAEPRTVRWESLSSGALPDTECLEVAAECLVGLSRIYVASTPDEQATFVSFLRTVVGRRHAMPLLLACARRPSGTENVDDALEQMFIDLGYSVETVRAFGLVDTAWRSARAAGWNV
jgi:hypothetical protein